MIQITDVKTIIRLIVNDQKVVFITIWPNAEPGRIQVEFAYGPKVSLIKKGQYVHIQTAMREIGIKIADHEAYDLAVQIRKNIEANNG